MLAELRALLPLRRRRRASSADAIVLLARVLEAGRVIDIAEGPGGITFRLALDDERLSCVLHHPSPAPLTAVEAAVAEQVCEGKTLAQVARLRGVSVNTVKSQVRQIFRKLNVDSRVGLVRRLAP
ncbi:MAG TPA: helix-turn-helix transcriptional regulator [Steroidobacteraceae bacterium]|nr:helix-turn-helix transcriptional regulator [Steroidobacteraceae bacterium]